MEFYDVVGHVLELLQRQKRVSYRALKRQFSLDDDYIEDLKEELLFSHPVVDEDGRGLVWTGETREAPEPTSQPDQPEPQPVVEQVQSTFVQTSSIESPVPDAAERRQLTVMFVDMVESTALSGALDPEDLRDVVRDYQQACAEVIRRYDGHVAQLLGDGLLVYFGYPQAHEDDPQRAVCTGLEIIAAIGALNTRLEQDKGVKLAVRLGIHTGLVVVGEMGGEGRQEQLALGETPNIASRIQGLAEPDTVVISADTYRLIKGYFDCESLGQHELPGVVQPIGVYHVLRESGVQSRLDVVAARGLTPLVGRESESTLLIERWGQAKDGNGQVVLLSGEAGIGKSRLVQVLKDYVAEGTHARLECRSSPYFTNSALYPITDFLQRTLRFQADDTPDMRLEKLIQNLNQYRVSLEETVPLFASLLSLPVPEDRYPPLKLSPQGQRQKTLESIVAILLELAERQPLLFILEDLHWTDPTTLELLELLIDQTPTVSLYVLVTCRPEFQPSWSHRSYLTEVTVNRLSRNQVERLAEQVAGGKGLPTAIVQQLAEKTDGVPLYVEEMTKSVLESGHLKEVDGHYELTGSLGSLTIPATLQDSLMARLDRLVTAKAVAQYASVIGRQFSYELLQAVSELDGATLQRELGRLVDTELVYQRGVIPQATYIFKHALIQDTAYESLLRSTRQSYHHQIAEVLEKRFPDIADMQPELLAHHLTEARCHEQAVNYWQQAGEKAEQRSAHLEAISHLTTGLELLKTLPETPQHIQQELAVQTLLGPALVATKGYASPEVEQVYARAQVLCQQVKDAPQLDSVLMGLFLYYVNRPNFQTSYELGKQFFNLAQQTGDDTILLQAHMVLGVTLFWLGQFTQARSHLEQSLALYDPQKHRAMALRYGQDSGVVCHHYASTLWVLGYPEQALTMCDAMLILAHELSHPLSLVYALSIAAFVHLNCRVWHKVEELSEASIHLATEHGFPFWVANSMTRRGIALVMQGQIAKGMEQIQEGFTARQATGSETRRPSSSAILAEAYGQQGEVETGLRVLTETITIVEHTQEGFYEPEMYRLKGELLLSQSFENRSEAESCFQKALEVSRHQQAKSLELRAATSLAKLWQSQGKRDDARALLAPVYNWFTEGFDTADLIDAKTLLDELS